MTKNICPEHLKDYFCFANVYYYDCYVCEAMKEYNENCYKIRTDSEIFKGVKDDKFKLIIMLKIELKEKENRINELERKTNELERKTNELESRIECLEDKLC